MPNVQTTRQPHPSSISTRAENPLFPAAWAASTAASIACSTVLYGEYSISPRAIFHIPLSGTIRYSTQDNGASRRFPSRSWCDISSQARENLRLKAPFLSATGPFRPHKPRGMSE